MAASYELLESVSPLYDDRQTAESHKTQDLYSNADTIPKLSIICKKRKHFTFSGEENVLVLDDQKLVNQISRNILTEAKETH